MSRDQVGETKFIRLAALGAAISFVAALALAGAPERAQAQGTPCTPRSAVEIIIDDSSSMLDNDPQNLRRRGMELLIAMPGNESMTLGAIEFSGEAAPLFGPAPVAGNGSTMTSILRTRILGDGTTGVSTGTNYNAAFALAGSHYPGAQARIFLTDGAHLPTSPPGSPAGPYADGHVGGPPTYVIGFGDSTSGEDGTRLARIANETGGKYFPATDSTTLQDTVATISAILNCDSTRAQFTDTFAASGDRKCHKLKVRRGEKLLITTTWADPFAKFRVVGLKVKRKGKLVAGTAKKLRKAKRLKVKRRSGETYAVAQVKKLKTGKLKFCIKATQTFGDSVATLVVERR